MTSKKKKKTKKLKNIKLKTSQYLKIFKTNDPVKS